MALIGRRPDLTLAEIREELGRDRGLWVGTATVWRFFAREKISLKKKPVRPGAGSAGRRAAARKMEAVSGPV